MHPFASDPGLHNPVVQALHSFICNPFVTWLLVWGHFSLSDHFYYETTFHNGFWTILDASSMCQHASISSQDPFYALTIQAKWFSLA